MAFQHIQSCWCDRTEPISLIATTANAICTLAFLQQKKKNLNFILSQLKNLFKIETLYSFNKIKKIYVNYVLSYLILVIRKLTKNQNNFKELPETARIGPKGRKLFFFTSKLVQFSRFREQSLWLHLIFHLFLFGLSLLNCTKLSL